MEIERKRLKTLNRSIRAAKNLIDELYTSDWAIEAGTYASRTLGDYTVDIAINIFEAFKGEIEDNEKDYLYNSL